jgi:hypothetical protein
MKSTLRALLSVFAVGLSFLVGSMVVHAAPAVEPSLSTISVDKASAKADGIDQIRVNVTIKNANFIGVENADVALVSSRGALDEISPATAKTSITGRASFYVKSLKNGSATLSVMLNGAAFPKSVNITFADGIALALSVGDLIKIPDDNDASTQPDSAVYYYASNGKRYVFPNEKVYLSWYPDFGTVKSIPIDQMSLIPIGGNITYRPGAKMVKFQTDTKTYLPTKGGILRWVQTEEVARGYFGTNWNQHVDDISEAFYVNYKFGEPIGSPLDLSLPIVQSSVNSINVHLGLGAP